MKDGKSDKSKKAAQDRFVAYGAIVGCKYREGIGKEAFHHQPYKVNYNIKQKARAHK